MSRTIALLLGSFFLVAGSAYGQRPGETRPGGPMMREHMMCGQMQAQADVKVEKTPDGAVLRLSAKDPKNVAAVQQHAEMMSRCMRMSDPPTK